LRCYAGTGAGRITRSRISDPAYESGIGQTVYVGCRNQPKAHVPTIKERTFPGMGEGDDDRVHSGGLPTTTVLRTVLSATVERSQSKKYKV
jgi:hypothetical protein